MKATLSKWGNSIGLRLPVALLQSMNLSENDQVSITEVSDGILIKKSKPDRRNFKQLMEDYYGKPLDQIDARFDCDEVSSGDAVGDEVW